MTTDRTEQPVTVTVDTAQSRGTLKRIWRSIGYDELNWTYTPLGKRIFKEIGELNDGPFWIRNHNIFSSGNLRSSPYVASTNCYSETEDGEPVYDWTTVDRIYDVYVENGCKPMVELDFMPHALSAFPQKDPYESGRYIPRDYDKWRELNRQFALHLIDRYGLEEVRTWYFSSWNEPDGRSWIHTAEPEERKKEGYEEHRRREFLKVHDYAIDGILAADDQLRVGGPDIAYHDDFLDMFLEHCDSGTNHATGKTGTRLDFISFHTKGTGREKERLPNPDLDLLARRDLLRYVTVVRKFPKFKALPILCNEWDIDVWSPGGIYDHPNFQFRNTSYFPVFLIRSVKELLDFAQQEHINLELITQWTFYFHGMRCFEGTRSIYDPMGIRKPVFNGFEMLARLGTERLVVTTNDTNHDIAPGQTAGTRDEPICPKDAAEAEELGWFRCIKQYPQVDGLAARNEDSVQVLVWNQVSDQFATGTRDVQVCLTGLGDQQNVRVTEFRIDDAHSNAHTVWQEMDCPDWPTEDQIAAMRAKEGLEKLNDGIVVQVTDGTATVHATIPTHGVSLFIVEGCS